MRPCPSSSASQSGFTLIELAIVIVIIGLLLGGILTGRNLLEAAETRSVYTDAETYIDATGQFVKKYGSLPGDMFEAENVWGQAAAGAACKTTNNNNKSTCNGNGNGHIELGTVTGVGGVQTVEHLRAWQQLVNASLIQGYMTGIPGAGGDDDVETDVNIPKGVIDGSGYTLYYVDPTAMANFFPSAQPYNHILHFGQPSASGISDAPTLLPQRAWEVDAKIDDGQPFAGSVRTYINTAQANCATADDNTATYDVNYEDARSCNLIFLTGF